MGDVFDGISKAIEDAQGSTVAAIFWLLVAIIVMMYILLEIIKAGRGSRQLEPATKDVMELQGPLIGLIKDFMGQVAQVAESNNKLAMAVEANTSTTEQLVRALSVSVHDEGQLTRRELGQDIKALVQVVDANNQLLAKVLKAWETDKEAPRKPGRPKKDQDKLAAMKTAEVK